MNEFEGTDQRKNEYSNIQHPFFLKPEFVVSSFVGAIVSVVLATLWFTDYVGAIEAIANKNSADIERVEQYTRGKADNFKQQFNDLKNQQMDLKHDINKRFDRIQDGIDMLVREQLKNGRGN